MQLVAQEQVVGDGQVVDQVELLVDGGDAAGQGRGRIAGRQGSTVDGDLAGGRGDQAGDALDERRLAGAVLADQAVDLPGGDREVDAVEGADAGVVLDQAPHRQQRAAALAVAHAVASPDGVPAGVDGGGGEDLLDHRDRAADDAGPVVEPAAGQLEVLGGQRGRAPVDDLAHAGEELLVGVGQVAADDDDRGVEEVDRPGQHLAHQPPGLADQGHGLGVAGPHQGHHVAAVVGLDADGAQLAGQGAAAGHGLDAAPVAAAAQGVAGVGDLHVAEVAGRAVGARWMAPPATMPQPMPVATLTNSRSSTPWRQLVQYSPSAITFTSLSTSTGTPG